MHSFRELSCRDVYDGFEVFSDRVLRDKQLVQIFIDADLLTMIFLHSRISARVDA